MEEVYNCSSGLLMLLLFFVCGVCVGVRVGVCVGGGGVGVRV